MGTRQEESKRISDKMRASEYQAKREQFKTTLSTMWIETHAFAIVNSEEADETLTSRLILF